MRRYLSSSVERFPIAGSFTISRGTKTEAMVVVCRITQDGRTGWGECVPYARYGESIEGVQAEIETAKAAVEAGASREEVRRAMRAGAARNAIDCALWDLEAKLTDLPVWKSINPGEPGPLVTAYTISLGEPAEMAAKTAEHADRALLKVKVGTGDDAERIRAVRAAAPNAQIILDANEGWSEETLEHHMAVCAEANIALVEQPLPAGNDAALRQIERLVPICADESVHLAADLVHLRDRYDAINIKLDKAGGLTEALGLRTEASHLGLKVMIGCMVGSSLAMAPAVLLAQGADFVDLDGPLLLARDRDPGLRYEGSLVFPPKASLWG
ncbi:L-alanine-DL-glutamate epimerase-like enolase superfamily enzyme [Rhizobium subbaraonis]|uniref:Dipeptide epimerase n=1 Tax=Rhizobium subbaraonis TaxID=908946 RepID=A0A285ULK4_9HYPH|nr:N-acetyl-D-Glu racemase DgcA [Rhizobium subbaraonis]SOC42729.1 L-alanine-DL-glutamate epimerase-like enolase superfamily enzyme [Rhizobium subbaraonis]